MAENYAAITAAPPLWRFEGRDYQVSKATPKDFGEMQRFLMSRIPSPKAEALKYMKDQPVEVQKFIWEEACEREATDWPPNDSNPSVRALILSDEGQAFSVYLALRKHIAGFDLEQAAAIASRMTEEDSERLGALVNPEAPAPKDETSASTTTEPTATSD